MERGLNFFILSCLFLILSISFISAEVPGSFWYKITGKSVTEIFCNESCVSLGYECGIGRICGNITDCGNCLEENICLKGKCFLKNITNQVIDCTKENCVECNISLPCLSPAQKCINNKCVIIPTCIDSDNGLNYYSKGKVAYEYLEFSVILNDVSIFEDYCSDDSLSEFFCSVDSAGIYQFGMKSIFCKYGCFDGSCNRWYSLIFRVT